MPSRFKNGGRTTPTGNDAIAPFDLEAAHQIYALLLRPVESVWKGAKHLLIVANGALAQSPMHKPSVEGVVIYLNANPDIDAVINRIEAAGGKILMPKMMIGKDIGSMAFFADTEGNKMGLHAGPVE